MEHVLAQTLKIGEGSSQITLTGPEKFSFQTFLLGSVIQKVVYLIFAFAGFGLLLMIISAGFSLLTSAGDAKKLEMGKQKLTYALAGFLIIFASFWLVQILGKIFGLEGIVTGIFT